MGTTTPPCAPHAGGKGKAGAEVLCRALTASGGDMAGAQGTCPMVQVVA